ncbi:hypothetical protein MBLNU230_g2393t1 [Neophaeotheca triangularis]
MQRAFADSRAPDKTVFPGSRSDEATAATQEPPAAVSSITNAQPIPQAPPSPVETHSKAPAPSTNTGNLPPTGTGSAATGPTSPKKPKRRFRNFLLGLFVLSTLGYAGGVYYSLVSDNFHDFFTEYVPYGEDAVAYFEEREFKRRFPGRDVTSGNWPQKRGENKVTIEKYAGLKPSVSQEGEGSDLSSRGRHSSSKESKPKKEVTQQQPEPATKKEKAAAVESSKKDAPAPGPAPAPATSSAPGAMIDQLNVSEATEPVVQNLVKMVNNIITTINASPDASKYSSTVNAAKADLDKIIGEIATLKQQTAHEADAQIKNAHTEFDSAARELVRRLETEMREQESKWRDEYESERERLSTSYQQRLAAELDAARQVEQSKTANSLLEQEIALQKTFSDSLAQRVEQERNGRLAKLDALSSSVADLESLASQSSETVDAALRTQHLQVAVEAVRNAVFANTETPQPFVNELVALKEVASDDNKLVAAAIGAINPQAYQRGLPSPAHLIDRFRRVAAEVRKASLLPEDAGVASHAASAVLSRFMFAKNERTGIRSLPKGDDVEATLSRAEVLLEEGDLDAAAREMNALKGWAGVLSRDWVAETRRVLEVRMAVEVMSAEARLQSLLVE